MAGRARVKEAFSALCAARRTVDDMRLRETHKNTKRAHQNNERCMLGEVTRETCNVIERAVDDNDSGKMFHGLRQLGVRLQGKAMMTETSVTTTAASEHFLRIGGGPWTCVFLPDETFSETPSYEHCWAQRDT